ncbi:MAG: hypothetical protein H3C26_03080 [Rhodocyclaceae bacterium]|nr:hypothetical protein [Rhodocyclaceae bacterium]
MKMTVIATAVLALAAAAPAFAAAQGGSSNTANVQVGPSDFPPGAPTGYAGISMLRNDGSMSGYVNIAAAPITQVTGAATANQAGPFYAPFPGDGLPIAQVWYNNQNAVANVYSLRQVRYLTQTGWPHFGGLVIGQVKGMAAGSGVYFGEWSPPVSGTPNQGDSTDLNMGSADRTVWYVGDNAVTSMPTLTNVTYNVVGIRQTGVGSNLPHSPQLYSGTLTANYVSGGSANALTGTLSRTGDANVGINSTIYGNGTFSGNGATGQFYNNATALAGIYTGGGAGNHVAFGGKQ